MWHGDLVDRWRLLSFCLKKFTQIIAWKKSRTNFWCCHETFEWLFGANYITLWMLFFFSHGSLNIWDDSNFGMIVHFNIRIKGVNGCIGGNHPPRSVRMTRFPNRSHPAPRRRIVVPPKLMCSSLTLGWCRLARFCAWEFLERKGTKTFKSQFPVMNQIRWKVNVWNTIILETWFCLPPSQSTLSSIFHYILRWQVKLVRTYVSHCFIGDFWWFDVSKTIGKYHVGQTQPLRSGDISPKVRLHFLNFLLISILLEEMSHGWILGFKNSQNSFTGW